LGLPQSLLSLLSRVNGTEESLERCYASSVRYGDKVMPILLWIAFWSSMTGVANGWQETMSPVRVKAKDRRDHSGQMKS
jgi:hypothetical protein